MEWNGSAWVASSDISASTLALSSLTAATGTNTIDNLLNAQTWNWSTATTESPLSISANALTTGSLLNLTTSNNALNSTNGLLYVANTGTSSPSVVAKIQSNSTAGSGLAVLANGNIGVGTLSPSAGGTAANSARTYLTVKGSAGSGVVQLTTPEADADGVSLGTFEWIDSQSTDANKRSGYINVATSGSVAANRGSAMAFGTRNDGGTSTSERARITNTGDMVIGSITATARLDVKGSTSDSTALGFNVKNSGNGSLFSVRNDGMVGIGTTTPAYALQVVGDINVSGNYKVNGVNIGGAALSGITAATTTNTIDNLLNAQMWNWSTATTQSPMSIAANALTTGSLLNLTSSNSTLNSTNGLLNVANTGTSTSGTVARIQSNSTAGSGLTVLANGNVGIGTASPSAKLDVSGNIGSSGFIYAPAAYIATTQNPATPVYTFNDATKDSGMFSPSLQQLGFSTSGIERMRIDTSGKIGIGTTTPAYSLQVSGDISISGNYKVNGVNIGTGSGTVTSVTGTAPISVATGTTTPVISMTRSTASVDGYLASGDFTTFSNKLTSSLTSGLIFIGNGSNVATGVTLSGDATIANTGVMTIANNAITTAKVLDSAITSAKILDGTITSNDLSAMGASTSGQVMKWNGSAWVASSDLTTSTLALSSITAATGTNTIDNLLNAQVWNWSTATTQSPMSISANALTTGSLLNLTTSNSLVNSTNGLLNVANTGTSTSGTVARIQSNSTAGSGLTVLANGNVGVGTDAPSVPLHMATGPLYIGTMGGGYSSNGVIVNSSSARSSVSLMNSTSGGTQTSDGLDMSLVFENADFTLFENGYMRFLTNNTERLRIDASGNVGIGTTTPAYALQVSGDISISGNYKVNGVNIGTGSGTVTSVTGTSPISVATGTTTPVISISKATTAVDGYLTSTDWTTFNAKQAAGSYITALTGDVTATGPGSVAATIAANAITTAKILDGTITSNDLSAMGASTAGQVMKWDGSVWVASSDLSASALALSSITAATGTNTIDSLNFAQTWNWSTATTQNPMSIAANALTTGSLLNLTSSNSLVNSTNGLLYVANTGTSTSGAVARIQSNSTAGSGLTVLANGNVGIGTTTPSYALDISGSLGNVQFTDGRTINFTRPFDNYINAENGTANLNLRAGGALRVFTDNSERVRVDVSGNVGIGTTTPTELLQIESPAAGSNDAVLRINYGGTDAATGSRVLLTRTSGAAGRDIGSIYFSQDASFGNASEITARGTAGGGTDLSFYTDPPGGSQQALRMYFTDSGYVGIGTSTPTYALQVSGDISISGNYKVNGVNIGTGSVTSVSGTAPISVATGTSTPVISMARSTASVDGYLSSGDFTTFSNKLTSSLTSGLIFVGNGSNVATAVTMSGDANMANTGVMTITNNAITTAKILDGTITSNDLSAMGASTSGQVMKWNGTAWVASSDLSASALALSSITAATGTNTIDSLNFAQTWNWSTATTQNPMSIAANALTTGSLLNLTSSNSNLVSTNGLLYVANTGTSTTGAVARIQSNSTAGSGLTVAADGKVGIGTDAPGTTLDVIGTSRADNFLFGAGTVGAPSLAFDSEPGTGMFLPGANTIGFSVAGSEALRIGASGTGVVQSDVSANIGVMNTDSTVSRTPTLFAANFMGTAGAGYPVVELINYRGNINALDPLLNGDIIGKINFGSTGRGASLIGYANENWVDGVQQGGALAFNTTENGTITSKERMRIDSAGLVGIGTTAPTSALDLSGDFTLRGRAAPGLSPAGQGRIYFDSAANKFKVSQNAGAYADLVGGSGTVTSVSGTSPISVATGTSTPVISMTRSTASVDGYLASSDFSTFSNKLTSSLTSGLIFVGNGSNVATAVTMSGDANMANTGVMTITNNAITTAKILDSAITTAKILDGTITSSDLATGSVTSTDILDGTITSNDLSAMGASTSGQVMKWNGTAWIASSDISASTLALSSLTAATGTNTIDSLLNAQTWNWSTATTQSPMSIAANALTTGSLLNLTTSNNSLNSTNGLLNVANTGTSVTGTVARIQSSSESGSGMTVLANGKVGIGTASPNSLLHISGAVTYAYQNAVSSSSVLTYTPACACDTSNTGDQCNGVTASEGLGTVCYDRTGFSNPNYLWNKYIVTTGGEFNVQATGRVGIGITSPAYSMQVSGDISISGNYKVNGVNIGSGTVTSVTGTAPISVATGTSTPVISMARSTASVDGYLSSGDFSTFSNKVAKAGDTMTGALISSAGTAGAPAIGVGATTLGLFNGGTNILGISTAGTEQMRINASGNVSIGSTAANTNTKLYVSGQISAKSGSTSSGAIDWVNGNAITTSYDCAGGALTFANIRDGGAYTLVVTSTSTDICTFSATSTGDDAAAGTLTYRFVPANTTRTASSHTVYSIQRIGTVVYISWITGF